MMEQSSLAPTASAWATQAAKARTAFSSLLTPAVAVILVMAAEAIRHIRASF